METLGVASGSWAEKTQWAAEAMENLKAEQIVVLDVSQIASFADAFVVASGTSDRHVQSIADAVVKAAKARGEAPIGVEGYQEGRWVLIDLADVVVHVFQSDVRGHYDLERLWSDAKILRGSPSEAEASEVHSH